MKLTRRILPVLLAFVALWAFTAPVAQQTQGSGDKPVIQLLTPVRQDPLVRLGPAPDLEILFSSEVRGYYQPCG